MRYFMWQDNTVLMSNSVQGATRVLAELDV